MQLIVLLLFVGTISRQQQSDFDLKNLKFMELDFYVTKEAIVNALGKGKRLATNYECGFFAYDQKGAPYYQLVYPNFNYIGSDKEKFFYLENVNFDTAGIVTIKYLERELTGRTTEAEFVRIFGDSVKADFVKKGEENSLLLYSKGSDDGAVFIFRKERLFKLQYWTPC